MGWSLIPLQPGSKEPLMPWKEYQTKKMTETELLQCLQKTPNMNLGLVTGPISGVVVIDLDGTIGLAFGQQKKITSSLVVMSGKGEQVYYKWTDGIKNSVSKISDGVDIRGEGGYVVLPPSIHPNGRRYRWLKPLANYTSAGMSLPSFPTEFGCVVAEQKEKSKLDVTKALEEMKHGNIDTTLVSILGRLRRDGYSASDAFLFLRAQAEERGATPGHLESKIEHIWNTYEPRPGNPGLNIHTSSSSASVALYNSRRQSGISLATGFPALDRMLEGGISSERLFTIAARTGTGKTNFAIALSKSLCSNGKRVLYFSTEFSYKRIWDRYKAYDGGVIDETLFVCDSFTPNLNQVEEAIKEIKPDVFIFDHINHLGEERETLSSFMQGCNFLQRKYGAQGIMVAQLNRQADWIEDGKRITPRMSMIKGAGTIEQASSRVLLLSETRVMPEYNEIIGVLDKNDSGDKGILQFGLYKNPYVFREL